MNWVGGRLSSSKRDRAGTASAKQKAYFAKARARLQQRPVAASPIHFSIFGDIEHTAEYTYHVPHTSQPIPSSSKRQRRLDEFEDVAPLVNRLASLKPAMLSARMSQRKGITHHQTNNGEPLHSSARNTVWREERDPQKRMLPPGPENDLETKRKALLRRDDWLGIRAAPPLKMTFPSARERQQVGRRRKLDEDDMERQKERGRARIPHYDNTRGLERLAQSPLSNGSQLLGNISIRIGTSIHGSQRTVAVQQLPQPLTQDLESDEMLFGSYSDRTGTMLLDNDVADLVEEELVHNNGRNHDRVVDNCINSSPKRPLKRQPWVGTKPDHINSTDLFFTPHRLNRLLSYADEGDLNAALGQQQVPVPSEPTPPALKGRLIFEELPQKLVLSSISSDKDPALLTDSPRSINAQGSEHPSLIEDSLTEKQWKAFLKIPESTIISLSHVQAASRDHRRETEAATESEDFDTGYNQIKKSSMALRQTVTTQDEDKENYQVTKNGTCTQMNNIEQRLQSSKPIEPDGELSHNSAPTALSALPEVPGSPQFREAGFPTADENEAWYKFVFGPFVDDKQLSQNSLEVQPSQFQPPMSPELDVERIQQRLAITDSLAVEIDGSTISTRSNLSSHITQPYRINQDRNFSPPRLIQQRFATDTGSLAVGVDSSRSPGTATPSISLPPLDALQTTPRVIFRKPKRFAEPESEENTIHLGYGNRVFAKTLRRKKRNKGFGVRHENSDDLWAIPLSDDDMRDEIHDE